MAFYSWFGVFGLSLAIAPAVAFIPREANEDFSRMTFINDVYDDDEYEREAEQDRKDFERVSKKMDDYSFRIFLPCATATGWILDYEIPEGNNYPTKWYIVTNAHVANKFRFSKDSYEKDLPKPALEEKSKYTKYKDIRLNTGSSCNASESEGYFDFNLSRAKNGKELRSDYGAIQNNQMNIPKLFYVPINFLKIDSEAGVKENNYRDFAVIEIEFTDKDYARKLTGDFYENYRVGSSNGLNVFAAPLNERKTWKEIEESYDNYYSLAYSWKGDWFKYDTNFNSEDGYASLLADSSDERPFKGHASASQFDEEHPDKMVKWGSKTLNSVGYFYALQYNSMSGGASGGLVVDKDGNVLGIRSLGNSDTQNSYIIPLRSNRAVNNGAFLSPAYDLILGGAPGQLTSYKGQVESKNKTTYLSKSGWKHPWNSRMNLTRSSCLGSMCFQK